MTTIPTVDHHFHEATNTITFIVYDASTKDAVIIDPVLDLDTMNWQVSTVSADKVLEDVAAKGLKVHLVMDTHTHADHLTGGGYLSKKLNVPYAIGANIVEVQKTFAKIFDRPEFQADGSQFGRLLRDEEVVEAGALRIRCISTPGHTPNCLSYLVGDALFCGDAMFTEDFGTGRCDFPGGSAANLYDSIQKIFALPLNTRVFVGHDYMPGGRELRVSSTVELQREKNEDITCRAEKQEFVEMKEKWDKTLNLPRLIFPSLYVNMDAGRLPSTDGEMSLRYIKIPLNLKQRTDEFGAAMKQ